MALVGHNRRWGESKTAPSNGQFEQMSGLQRQREPLVVQNATNLRLVFLHRNHIIPCIVVLI